MHRSELIFFWNVEYLLAHRGALGIIKDHKERFKESKDATRASKVNFAKDTATRAQKFQKLIYGTRGHFFQRVKPLNPGGPPSVLGELRGLQ